jgi:hypothetical protein
MTIPAPSFRNIVVGCIACAAPSVAWAQNGIYYGPSNCNHAYIATEYAMWGLSASVSTDKVVYVPEDMPQGTLDQSASGTFANCAVNLSPWLDLPSNLFTSISHSGPTGGGSASQSLAVDSSFEMSCTGITVAASAGSSGAANWFGQIPAKHDHGDGGGSAGVSYDWLGNVYFCLKDKGTFSIQIQLDSAIVGCDGTSSGQFDGSVLLSGPTGDFWQQGFTCPAGGSREITVDIPACAGAYQLAVGLGLDASASGNCFVIGNPGLQCSGSASMTTTSSISASLTFTPCIGDVNNDGVVDISDLSLVLSAYGAQEGDPNYSAAADLNHDGSVDLADLSLLFSNFGGQCPVC